MSESSWSSESISEPKSSKCIRKSYTINEKLSAIRKFKEFDGNVSKTSRALDIDRKTLP
jgi:transposase-like protein